MYMMYCGCVITCINDYIKQLIIRSDVNKITEKTT